MSTTVRINHEGYPLSSLGKTFEIKHIQMYYSKNSEPDKCCMYFCPCICIHENEYWMIFMIIIISGLLWPIWPVIVLFKMCYYRFNPEIVMTNVKDVMYNIIDENIRCPKCISGIVKFSILVDGGCGDKDDYFICEKCLTVYQGKLPTYLIRFDPELERSGKHLTTII